MNALEIKDLSKSFGSFSLQNLTLTVPMGTALGSLAKTARANPRRSRSFSGSFGATAERSAFSGKSQTATASPSARTSA